MPNEVALLTCAAMETAFAQLQQQSPNDYAKLRQIHSKVFCIQLSQLNWPLYLVFARQIQVLSHYEGDVDVKVEADATTLYQLSEGANLTELIKQDKLKIEGELSLLQCFSQYLQQTHFDFAEPISRYLGDGPTHILLNSVKSLSQGAKHVASKTLSHLEQLAVEEYKLSPSKIEFIHRQDQIAELQEDTQALEQKINQLKDRFVP